MIRLGLVSFLFLGIILFQISTTVSLEYGEKCTPALPPAPTPTQTQTQTQAQKKSKLGHKNHQQENTDAGAEIISKADNPTCNATAWLECNANGTCVCQQGTILGKDRKTCVSIIGQPCQQNESDPASPRRSCIENAICTIPDDTNKTSMCQCATRYIPLPGNKICRLGFGSDCILTDDCNTNALLTCQSGKCMCDRQEMQSWDPIQNKCLALVGGQCDNSSDAFIKRPCVQNAFCNDATLQCECNNGTHKETKEKRCLLNYGQNCSMLGQNDQCHPYYQCVITNATEGKAAEPVSKCGCNSTYSEYDEDNQVCSILAGQKCSPATAAGGNAFCVERAVCSERYRACKCEPDFKQTADGHCAGGYRADCNLASDKCDEEMNFVCNDKVDHKCDCKTNYTYSSDARKCVGYVDMVCTMNSDCYELAECNLTSKKCVCREGYSATPDDHCLVSYAKYCIGPNRCNPYDFLLCDDVNKSCACQDQAKMTLDPGKGKCVGLAGAHCYTAAMGNRTLGCVTRQK